jgi:predicted anti-sigma-YlaC factor YlaD
LDASGAAGNSRTAAVDSSDMDCEHWRDALSARLDGEPLGLDTGLLDSHLSTCSGCRVHTVALQQLHRSMRLRAADPVPDLTDAILSEMASGRRPRADLTLILRWVLVVIAAIEAGLATPGLLSRWHTGSELGTWGIAMAIGFLSVALKPSRAGALLPMLACAGGLTLFVTIRHLIDGVAFLSNEWPHAFLLLGVGVLVLIRRREVAVGDAGPRPEQAVDSAGNRVRIRFRRAA